MPNWFSRQMEEQPKARYTFSAYGDIFVPKQENEEEEKNNAEEVLIGKLPIGDGVKTNNYEIELYKSVF